MRTAERLAGGALAALGLAAAWMALGFRVTFPADPVGPRALPLFAAGLMALGGAFLLFRPRSAAPDARADVPTAGPRPDLHPGLRLGAAVAVFAAYPAVLPLAGFVAATGGAMGVLAVLVRGPPLRAFAAAFALAGALWLLFALALGVPLPVGRLFLLPDG